MLEDKRKILIPSWAKRVMKDNGNGGIESFIQANSTIKARKKPHTWTSRLRDFKKDKAITWNGSLINPKILNVGNSSFQRITNIPSTETE